MSEQTDAPPRPETTIVTIVWAVLGDRRVRYVLAGGVAAVVYYGVFAGGWLLFGGWIPYLAMTVVANLATAISTYPLYRTVVFRVGGPWVSGFFKFYAVSLWSLFFTLGGMAALVEVVRLPVLVAQAILVVVGPLINYQMNRMWTFRARKDLS